MEVNNSFCDKDYPSSPQSFGKGSNRQFWTLGCSNDPPSLSMHSNSARLEDESQRIEYPPENEELPKAITELPAVPESKSPFRRSMTPGTADLPGTTVYESASMDSPVRIIRSGSSTPRSRIYGSHPLNQLRNQLQRDWKLSHTDSGQSSLECWDYSVELEMLKGPEGKFSFQAVLHICGPKFDTSLTCSKNFLCSCCRLFKNYSFFSAIALKDLFSHR